MDYKELNDNELVYLCSENTEEAYNIVIDKYKPIILKILKEILSKYNIVGNEINDFYQEGLIGLLHAINTFDSESNVTFYTYASKCIRNNIMSALRLNFRLKNRILNNSCSLDKLLDDEGNNFYNLFGDSKNDPSNIVVDEDGRESLIKKILGRLSENERVIFDLKLKGLDNNEIGELLNKDVKQIQNTICRIKIKYKEITKNN